MNLPRVRVAAIWAISAWPAINYLTRNWYQVVLRGPSAVVGVVLVTVLLGVTGNLIHHFASRKQRGGVVVVIWFALVALLFSYSTFSALTNELFDRTAIAIPAMAVWLVVVAAVAAFIFRYRKSQKLQVASMTFGVVVGGIAVAQFLVTVATYESPPRELEVAAERAFVAGPPRLPGLNVYYIILDAYGGKRGVQQATGFDNADFYARMAAYGFTDVSNEKSNYMRTVHTLGGIFAMDYPQTDDPHSWKYTRGLYPDLFQGERPPALVRRLSAAGYISWHSATTWGGCSHKFLRCIGDTDFLGADYVTQAFLSPTPFGQPLMYMVGERDNAFSSITSRLPGLLAEGHGNFIFAHHMAPHPPFLMDSHCMPRDVRVDNWNGWDPGEEQAYVDSIKCVNSQVERLVEVITRLNPNALIVLQGDHGSAFSVPWEQPMAKWPLAAVRERASFLNLVRAPASCRRWLDHPMGQINTARFVVACIEGQAPEYLPEESYMTTYSLGDEKGAVRKAPPF